MLIFARIRRSDTPHIFYLVLTDVLIIEKIDYLAPSGKSDHSILFIETSVLGCSEQNSIYPKTTTIVLGNICL